MVTPNATTDSTAEPLYPPLGRRYFASFIDGVVIVSGMLVLGTLLDDIGPRFAPLRAIRARHLNSLT